MIAKGNTHANGEKLARYMMTAKDGERAELFQLCGFAAGDIREAFRSVHVMAEATRCEQPFFHLQVRNPEGEELSRNEWLRVANRIEDKLGLTNQPRAICLHIDEQTGHEHMHVAWSRIDADTMTARPLPFFKERLKEVCRELENTLDLTRVKNERDGPVLAPNRNEFEQARRLGVDIKDVRANIRDCWDRSDCGRSFQTALAEHGWVLAQGDRRAFLVIDHEGGLHALGKRILGLTAGQTRERLADLDRDTLPTVEQAKEIIREQQVSRKTTRSEPTRDPHREEMAWEDALAKSAIEKEKIERRFVEPRAGGKDKDPRSPFEPPAPNGPQHPEFNRTSPEYSYSDVAREVARDKRPLDPPENLRGVAADIWGAYNRSHDAHSFAASLDQRGILLAMVTKEEAARSHQNGVGKERGRFVTHYRAGEIVAVAEHDQVYRLNKRTTGDERSEIDRFLTKLDRTQLQGIEATKEAVYNRPVPLPRLVTAKELRGIQAQLLSDWCQSDNNREFAEVFYKRGLSFARVTKEEAEQSRKQALLKRQNGNFASRYREGEIVLVTESRPHYWRDNGQIIQPPRVHRMAQVDAAGYLDALGIKPAKLLGIEATKELLSSRKEERDAHWQATRIENAARRGRPGPTAVKEPQMPPALGKTAGRAVSKTLDLVNNTVEALFAPVLTPEAKREGAVTQAARAADAAEKTDYSRYLAEREQARRIDQDQEAARQRQRDDRER